MADPKPFDPDAYLAASEKNKPKTQGFDPDAYLASREPKQPEADFGTKARVFSEQAADVFTLGYLPQIEGGIRSLVGPETYLQEREAVSERMRQGEKEAPAYATAGKVAGVGAGLLIPGGVATQAATKLGALGRAAGTGAAMGLIADPGDVQGEVTPLQLEQRGKQALSGAALGGLLGAGGQAVGKMVSKMATPQQKAAGLLREAAGRKAFKAVGPYKRDVTKAGEKMGSIGKTLLDEKVVKVLPASYEKLAKRATDAFEKVGRKYGNVIDDIAKKSNVNVDRSAVAQKAMKDLMADSDIPGIARQNQRVQLLLDQFGSKPPMNILEAQKLRKSLKGQINWDRLPGADIPINEQVYRKIYFELGNTIEDAAKKGAEQAGADLAQQYLKLRGDYHNLRRAAEIASKRAGGEFANRFASLSDYQAGQTGAMMGTARALAMGASPERMLTEAVVGGVIGALTNKGFRRFANQAQAQGALRAANMLDRSSALQQKFAKSLEKIAKENPEKMVQAMYRLSLLPDFAEE